MLLDIDMPGLSGADALPTIRAMAPRAVVIMVSGTNDESVAKRTLAFGAFDYLVKPIDFDYLVQSLESALAMRALEARRTARSTKPTLLGEDFMRPPKFV